MNLPEAIYHAFSRGEITKEDYDIQTSAWVADNTKQYLPQPMPLPSQPILDYIRNRSSGSTTYDEFKSRSMGEWFIAYVRVMKSNVSDASLMLWCAEKLDGAKLTSAADRCRQAFERFKFHQPDTVLIHQVKEAKERDSYERNRKTG